MVRDIARRLARDERGATALEYGLIVALIVIVAFVAMQGLGRANSGIWNNVSNKVATAGPG